MAALVLVVGVLATAGSMAASVREAQRARAADAAAELLAARVVAWRRAPCVAESGERVLGAGPWGAGREWWTVRVAGGVGVLADTVRAGARPLAPRVGVVAVAGCGP